jgi:integrase
MRAMPRPRKPFIQREVNRHGSTVWYFRRGKGPRIRLPGAFGSPEFETAYQAALSGVPVPEKATEPRTSLRWLVDRYFESGRFQNLRPSTQRKRRQMLVNVCETGGRLNFRDLTAADLQRGVVRREATPFAAQNYLKIMRALFEFAIANAWRDTNPCDGVKIKVPKTDGHHTWTVAEVEKYQAKHKLGTKARLALDILLYTGLRRGDAVKLGRQHIKAGVITYKAGKNDFELVIPLLPPLAASIEATKRGEGIGDFALLCSSRGTPWVKEAFGSWFAEQCIAAGVPGRAHGLRKAGATFSAEGGANEIQLMAMWGWNDSRMAQVYIRKANRKHLAEQAANALSPHLETVAGAEPENAENSMVEK